MADQPDPVLFLEDLRLEQRADQLLHEERVSARAFDDERQEPRRSRASEGAPNEFRDAGRIKGGELDRVPCGHAFREARLRFRPASQIDKDPRVVTQPGELAGEGHRRRISPMEVLDRHDEGRFLRQRLDDLAERGVQPAPERLGAERCGLWPIGADSDQAREVWQCG